MEAGQKSESLEVTPKKKLSETTKMMIQCILTCLQYQDKVDS